MTGMISRREFLVISGAGLVASRSAFTAEEQVPRMLDHLLLGCNDLNRAVSFVEEHTSVRAATGGVHPGRGTRNALLSLGERRYLEIISIDPAQEKVADFAMPLVNMLKSLTTPRLVGWAAHPADIEAMAGLSIPLVSHSASVAVRRSMSEHRHQQATQAPGSSIRSISQ